MNTFNATGRLTKNPEIKFLQNGMAVTNLTIAVNRKKTQNNSEPGADYLNCVAWGKTAKNVADYTVKGSHVAIVAEARSRTYNKDDQTHYVVDFHVSEIEFLDSKEETEARRNKQKQEQEQEQQQSN
ncbi:single-stranded DNA-binding protein [Listeria seeligeri]|uniref:single-stranded DNA-binding protein n=1 Tax=Listeria seeligeri TaxID=1640 RepID=UPI0016270846|nr:single-stranded DNA-binding protein [Listeria seeligeri]MBC1557021.1 single-stranded DNA-binding protein [Listeria seeligeri]